MSRRLLPWLTMVASACAGDLRGPDGFDVAQALRITCTSPSGDTYAHVHAVGAARDTCIDDQPAFPFTCAYLQETYASSPTTCIGGRMPLFTRHHQAYFARLAEQEGGLGMVARCDDGSIEFASYLGPITSRGERIDVDMSYATVEGPVSLRGSVSPRDCGAVVATRD